MTTRKIGIVVSSSRPTRIGHKVAGWVHAQAPEGADVDLIDLAEVGLPHLADPETPRSGNYAEPSTIAWAEKIRSYDGLVITTPEYNGGYPAILKNAIDTLFAEWNGLPVGVVGYGWGAGADAARQLGEVLARVEAVVLPGPGLKFGEALTPEGEFLEAAPAAAAAALFEQIAAAAQDKAPAPA
ncbi:NAD(P)H-dependent oxidoreductase [Myceligenerans crystallogenes]|uniref:NAD(P)H-dependent oxidoreductase n=1 Tax=Myceligenerans crystallogenes TaxID=316335 RepID=A0ABP4ZFJ5_9MICO